MSLRYLVAGKCPRCHQGDVFQHTHPMSLLAGKMNTECPVCHTDFTKEPGFYWGAMYASYGLALGEAFITYFICRLFGTGTFDLLNMWAMVGAIMLFSLFNFRMARMIWLYIFP